MGVSRSRDDYRLGEPVIQDMYPPFRPGGYSFSSFFLGVDRDGGTFAGGRSSVFEARATSLLEGRALLRRNERSWPSTGIRTWFIQGVSYSAPVCDLHAICLLYFYKNTNIPSSAGEVVIHIDFSIIDIAYLCT